MNEEDTYNNEEEIYNNIYDEEYYDDDDDRFTWRHILDVYDKNNNLLRQRRGEYRCREVMLAMYSGALMYMNQIHNTTARTDFGYPPSKNIINIVKERYPHISVESDSLGYTCSSSFGIDGLREVFLFNWWTIMLMRGGYERFGKDDLWYKFDLFLDYISRYVEIDYYLYAWYNPCAEKMVDVFSQNGLVSAMIHYITKPLHVKKQNLYELSFFSPYVVAEYCGRLVYENEPVAWYVRHEDVDDATFVAKALKYRYPYMDVWVSETHPYQGRRVGFRTNNPFFPILWSCALFNAKAAGSENEIDGFYNMLPGGYFAALMRIWHNPELEQKSIRTVADLQKILKEVK